jgi:hypothetical protein
MGQAGIPVKERIAVNVCAINAMARDGTNLRRNLARKLRLRNTDYFTNYSTTEPQYPN